ncbi:MAG: hypothetical protein IT372_02850, partial [Polyangiaceae bacterium]|nr:hypothetical protein [Polyangiaceae bacterium]
MRRVILEMMALVTAATLTGAPALGAGPDPRPPGEPAAGSTVADHMKRGDAARLSRRTTGIALTATAAVAGAGTLLWSEALTSDIDDRMRGKDPGACLHPDQQCKDVRRMIAQRDALDRIGVV